jgi:CheY-like chemotaxis protein
MPARPRILVADDTESIAIFREALTTSYELLPATTLKEARAVVTQSPDLVVCGCHFDEGRMYDLLRFLKAAPGMERIPFLAVRCVEDQLLDDALYESVKIAVRALGGNAFVDLLRWQRRFGAAEASHRLTRLVDSLLQAGPVDTL